MSLFLTKVLRLFIQPMSLGLLLVLGGLGLAWWQSRLGLGLVGIGVVVLWVPAMPVVADWAQGTLEHRFPPRAATEAPSADAIVVLGGSLGLPLPPREYPDLTDASDRVWHASRLYHAGKAPLIIASGGTLPWRNQTYREAPVMQALLTSWGVPADSILLEAQSSTTYGNATQTAEVMGQRGLDRVLLVTSALHMRRALATFRAAGIRAIPAATDYHVVEQRYTIQALLPDASALARSTAAIREYVGYIYYDVRGWIATRAVPVEVQSSGERGGQITPYLHRAHGRNPCQSSVSFRGGACHRPLYGASARVCLPQGSHGRGRADGRGPDVRHHRPAGGSGRDGFRPA